ncbi:MAG: hypothetical protein AVDCRST_MAG49-1412, partial [uncultured Thermomicrobiales bacterium]
AASCTFGSRPRRTTPTPTGGAEATRWRGATSLDAPRRARRAADADGAAGRNRRLV